MKKFLLILFLFSALMASAAGIKLKSKTIIKPYTITIEKVMNMGDKTLIYGKVIQQKRFSYSIAFDNCMIKSDESPNGIEGKLIEWNGNNKINNLEKTISDEKEECFVLEFPHHSVPNSGYFSLRLGTILNKDKSPIVINDLTIEKKKK